MCTISLIPLATDDGRVVRLVCNRDERRSRPAALPPVERKAGRLRAIYPIDLGAGGTWIAANDAGIVMTLLNVNPAPAASKESATACSRGTIIPSLLHLESVDDVVRQALQLNPLDYSPFRLVVASLAGSLSVMTQDGRLELCGPVLPNCVSMATSSGLGDELVEPPRARLFDDMLGDGRHSAAQQDLFHQHAWPERRHLSVTMGRADARTVSRTIVEIRADSVTMRYAPLDDAGNEGEATVLRLAVGRSHLRSIAKAGAGPCE